VEAVPAVLDALKSLMIHSDYSHDDNSRIWSCCMAGTAAKKPRTRKRVAAAKRASSRPPVLSEAALAYAKKIEKDPKLAIEFLKKAGIIERPGKLARPYR
jgi:hypothetical protein